MQYVAHLFSLFFQFSQNHSMGPVFCSAKPCVKVVVSTVNLCKCRLGRLVQFAYASNMFAQDVKGVILQMNPSTITQPSKHKKIQYRIAPWEQWFVQPSLLQFLCQYSQSLQMQTQKASSVCMQLVDCELSPSKQIQFWWVSQTVVFSIIQV